MKYKLTASTAPIEKNRVRKVFSNRRCIYQPTTMTNFSALRISSSGTVIDCPIDSTPCSR